jgi:hypothetical protein
VYEQPDEPVGAVGDVPGPDLIGRRVVTTTAAYMNLPIPNFMEQTMAVKVKDEYRLIRVELVSPFQGQIIRVCTDEAEADRMAKRINSRLIAAEMDSLMFVYNPATRVYSLNVL